MPAAPKMEKSNSDELLKQLGLGWSVNQTSLP